MEQSNSGKSALGPVFQIDEERIQSHLGEVVQTTVEETLNALLDAEADHLCGARKYERSEGRKDTRAGSYDRRLQTKAGEVKLTVPKLRTLPFETAIIERYRRRESSVEEALIEMYLAGVSVRRVEDITQALWGTGVGLDSQRAEPEDLRQDRRVAQSAAGGRFSLCVSRSHLAQAQLGRREQRLKRIAEAKRELEERARSEAEEKKEPQHKQAKPKQKDQHNFTDPESRIMKGPNGFMQAYNAQIAVEPVLQLIVGQAVTQQANDKKQLLPMIEKVKQQSGQKLAEVLADSGYCSEENLRQAAKKKVDLYVATGKQKHNQSPPPCPRGPIPNSATLVEKINAS